MIAWNGLVDSFTVDYSALTGCRKDLRTKPRTMTGMQSKSWGHEFTKQIGRGIEGVRGGRSDQWIADRTELLGHPLSRTAVSEYRRGIRKTMPVTDWLVIAAALEVPPVTLLFPGLPNRAVELLPDSGGPSAFDALRWVCGERQTPPEGFEVLIRLTDGEMIGTTRQLDYSRSLEDVPRSSSVDVHTEQEPSEATQLLRLCRELASLYQMWAKESAPLWDAVRSSDFDSVERLKVINSQISQRKTELERQIEELGGDIAPPKMILSEDGDSGGVDGEG